MKSIIGLALLSSLIVPCFGSDKLIGKYYGHVYESHVDGDEKIRCSLEIYAGENNSLSAKAEIETGFFSANRAFNFQLKRLEHPASDSNWNKDSRNYSESTYAYTDYKKSGEKFVLYLDKTSGSLVPYDYTAWISQSDIAAGNYPDGLRYPWYSCVNLSK